MSRPMRGTEIEEFEARYGYEPLPIRGAIDALGVFVHKDNPLECLSLQQVDAIFSSTRAGGADAAINTWGDAGLEGEWANRPIALYGRNSASGTYGYFKDVALFGGDYRPEVREQPGSSTVIQGVASDINGIGYSGVGYATADVKPVAIEGPDGNCYQPDAEAAMAGNYGIARFLYIYVNKNPNEDLEPLRGEFIRFVYSQEGQEAVTRAGFFPVNAALADQDLGIFGLTN
jgi:phosphate transport system substrate-binding protein